MSRANAPILILSLLFLTSCASTTSLQVDAGLTVACDKPELEGKKWRDLAIAYVKRGEAIDNCNDRLKLIRQK